MPRWCNAERYVVHDLWSHFRTALFFLHDCVAIDLRPSRSLEARRGTCCEDEKLLYAMVNGGYLEVFMFLHNRYPSPGTYFRVSRTRERASL